MYVLVSPAFDTAMCISCLLGASVWGALGYRAGRWLGSAPLRLKVERLREGNASLRDEQTLLARELIEERHNIKKLREAHGWANEQRHHWKQEAALYKNDYEVEQTKRLAAETELRDLKKAKS